MKSRLLFIPFIFATIFIFWFLWQYMAFKYAPIFSSNNESCFVLPQGKTARQFIQLLNQSEVTYSTTAALMYLRLTGKGRHLHAGEYCFSSSASAFEVINAVSQGHVKLHAFTLVEGWTYYDVLQALKQKSYLAHDKLDRAILKPYHNPEGLFMPDTYFVPLNTKETELLIGAHYALSQFLKKAWAMRADGLPYANPYQALIAASIIEKETAIDAERKIIAGVIVNRLRKKMYLQMDPTVIYGLGGHAVLTHEKLRQKTPYNTYRHIGLPPTPICMPGRASIIAALHPQQTDYLYFVATGAGGHHFSATLQEQNRAVAKYIQVQGSQL